jgi:phenylalanine-4-hydroxylase
MGRLERGAANAAKHARRLISVTFAFELRATARQARLSWRARMKSVGIVELDRDHPGFRDPIYRARRDEIARLATAWEPGAPLPDITYTERENRVWSTALAELRPMHERYACAEFLDAWPRVAFDDHAIPSFSHANARIESSTGFRLEPVAGLATPAEFMGRLAAGAFLATQYVRHDSAPLYTPEPDVLHELIGHAALLGEPTFATLNRLFGEATLRARPDEIDALIRVYWFTLEFGVIGRPGAYRVIGAGLLSSFGELGRFETEAEKLPFDLETIAATPFDPTDYQRRLFVAADLDEVVAKLTIWLGRIASR